MSVSIVYCYITSGENSLPDHLFDSLYQTFLIHSKFGGNNLSEKGASFYLITNKKWSNFVQSKIKKMNVSGISLTVIPSEILEKSDIFYRYNKLSKHYSDERTSFRNGFWIYTTTRFLYISAFMEEFNVERVFHIETDVIIYQNLEKTLENLKKLNMQSKIVAVQDAPHRAVCSLVYLPTISEAKMYSEYIINTLERSLVAGLPPLNDMDLMGIYPNKFHFPDSPYHKYAKELGVYDANGIGQYLGGIDFKNIPANEIKNRFVNPTRGFINETASFKPNTAVYTKAKMNKNLKYNGKKFFIGQKTTNLESELNELLVIHVHSKQLYLFSSVFDLSYLDIITGDRIISHCDFVIVDRNQFLYNRNLMKHNQNVILIKDFNSVDMDSFNKFIDQFGEVTGSRIVKLFVFIDIMNEFAEKVLPKLNSNFRYVLYSHNGDYPFDSKYINTIVNNPKIVKIFAQNLDIHPSVSEKICLLPIGIARDLFPHGNLETLYEIMTSTYYLKKDRSIYININESTHPFRKEVMDTIRSSKWNDLIITEPVDFKTYLQDLSRYRFCLCLRGNGLDTHRFWEALYLGVIPVVVYHPSIESFLCHLRKMLIPHVLINSFSDLPSNYFSEELYNSTLRNKFGINVSIQVSTQLQLLNYF